MGIFKTIFGQKKRSPIDRRSGEERRGTYRFKFSDPRKLRRRPDPRTSSEARRGWRRISKWKSADICDKT